MAVSPMAPVRAARPGGKDFASWQTTGLLLAGVLTALRFATALHLPLSFDEAYFWLWSKNLAVSYYDHPPLIALAIKAGTMVFGDTEFGVRAVSLLASVAASWAVWRAGAIFASEAAGAIACVLFNVTLMIASQSMSATPDALVLAESAFLLWAIAKLQATNDGRWWIAAGLALAAAFLTKYTAFFLGGGVGLWALASDDGRKWLKTPWPYLAAFMAFIAFVPNLMWNATHDWVSFKFQFGRVVSGKPTLKHVWEFAGSQIALASPFILILAAITIVRDIRAWATTRNIALTTAIVVPAFIYFTLHSIHDRVQGNWPSFVYPALCILAAQAMTSLTANRMAVWSRMLVLPTAALILFFAYAQAWTGFLAWGIYDPVARMTAAGISPVADGIAEMAAQRGAAAIVTSDYVVTGWLCFYLRPPMPVLPVTQDFRYLQAPRASLALLEKPLIYVTRNPKQALPEVSQHFSNIHLEKTLPRMKSGAVVDNFYVYTLSGFHGAPVGRLPYITGERE